MFPKTLYKSRVVYGQASIELVVGLIALIPIFLVICDLGIIVFAVQRNDSICREAARAVSVGDPANCQLRAKAVISNENGRGSPDGVVSNVQLVTSSVSSNSTGGSSVTVQTKISVKPFVIQLLYGGNKPISFISQQSFPITYAPPVAN